MEPTGLPPIMRIGKSDNAVRRINIGLRTSASGRISTSMMVGAGYRFIDRRVALISREIGEYSYGNRTLASAENETSDWHTFE